ncbi:Terpene synthase [Quillaja saponaria]|uniref:Terpene synthase n=1 Tax=Quillaja saponaria TaxID=32244 RepID=A0AAD7VMD3_QUISA|nr:Terpene synthase [Quillaja saponaria]
MTTEFLCIPFQSPLKQKPTSHPLNKYSTHRTYSAKPRTLQVICAMSTQNSRLTENRRSANYQPNTWSHDFEKSLKDDQSVETYQDRAAKLEIEVRHMINRVDTEPLSILELIDDVQRLGLGYMFQKDITRALERILSLKNLKSETETSLHASALRFRLLRQNGFEVSQGLQSTCNEELFKILKDNEGNFKAGICSNVKGMLSLYEASFLSFEGENLLDEAKIFTTTYLTELKQDVGTTLAEQVNHAMELPYHHRMYRLDARWFIETYDKKENVNCILLELAKINFNMVQSIYQRELGDMSRWWKEIGLANKLSFARDRLTESFFWALGIVSEPQFSNCRKELTKVAALITVIDDVYDVYGTLDELELFTDAIERWDVNAVHNLPQYMKLCFLALYNTVNEMAYNILKEQGEFSLPYLTKAWADLCKSFLQEAKWSYSKFTPTFAEYLENAWLSSSGGLFLVHAYFLLGLNVSNQELYALNNYHDLLRLPSTIFRLCNDLATSTAELETGETANSIACCINDTGLLEEQPRQYLRNLIDRAWKKLNKERFQDSTFDKHFAETACNLARIAQCTYQYGDGHGRPDSRSKNRVKSLIIEPIPLRTR